MQECKYVLGAVAFQFMCYVNISPSQTETHLAVDRAYSVHLYSTVSLGTCSERRPKLHG